MNVPIHNGGTATATATFTATSLLLPFSVCRCHSRCYCRSAPRSPNAVRASRGVLRRQRSSSAGGDANRKPDAGTETAVRSKDVFDPAAVAATAIPGYRRFSARRPSPLSAAVRAAVGEPPPPPPILAAATAAGGGRRSARSLFPLFGGGFRKPSSPPPLLLLELQLLVESAQEALPL